MGNICSSSEQDKLYNHQDDAGGLEHLLQDDAGGWEHLLQAAVQVLKSDMVSTNPVESTSCLSSEVVTFYHKVMELFHYGQDGKQAESILRGFLRDVDAGKKTTFSKEVVVAASETWGNINNYIWNFEKVWKDNESATSEILAAAAWFEWWTMKKPEKDIDDIDDDPTCIVNLKLEGLTKKLVETRADINSRGYSCATPVHRLTDMMLSRTTSKVGLDALDLLLKAGADLDVPDGRGMDVFDRIKYNAEVFRIEHMSRHKSDSSFFNPGNPPRHDVMHGIHHECDLSYGKWAFERYCVSYTRDKLTNHLKMKQAKKDGPHEICKADLNADASRTYADSNDEARTLSPRYYGDYSDIAKNKDRK